MTDSPNIVLPGLDGTSLPYRAFVARTGARVIEYPRDEWRYSALADFVAAQLPPGATLIAESFGGAIAVLVASRMPVARLTLVNSFITPPLPRAVALLPIATLSRVDVPEWLLAWWMLAPHSRGASVLRDALRTLPPGVIAGRNREALRVDVRRELAATTMPLVDVRARGDRLVRGSARRAIVEARYDAQLIDVDGPHALLFERPYALQ